MYDDPKVAAEVKSDDEEGAANQGAGLVPFGVCSMILGIAMIGLTIPWLTAPGIGDFQTLLAEGGSAYAGDFQVVYVALGGGVLSIVGGVIGIVGGMTKKRIVGIIGIVLVIAGGAMKIASVVYLQSVLDGAFTRLQASPLTTTFNEKDQSLLDVTGIIYNKCCFEVYDPMCGSEYQTSGGTCTDPLYLEGEGLTIDGQTDIRDNQLPVRACSDNPCASSQYPPIIDTVTGIITNLEDLLCTCYEDTAAQTKWEAAITKLDSCVAMEKIVIKDAGAIVIPTTAVKFSTLPTLVGATRPELSNEEIEEMAVVGKIYPPASLFGEPAADIGWSCGVGYAKAVAFTVYLGLDQASQISIIGGYVVGGLEVFVAALVVIYWLMGGGSKDDWNLDHYDTAGSGGFDDPYK